MPIEVGMSFTAAAVVDKTNLASTVGSGSIDVFATPMMIALMESAASACIAGCLEPGQSSVGTKIDVSHTAATVAGMKVTATATVTAVDRRRVDFKVTAHDDCGEIGSGTHTRFIIDVNKFMEKAQTKNIGQQEV